MGWIVLVLWPIETMLVVPSPHLHLYCPTKHAKVFLIDDSSSMKPYRNDLVHVFHALAYIVKTKDPDGLDLKFTNSPDWHHNDDTTPLVKKVKAMSPHGQCSMKAALDHVLQKFSPATKGPRSKPTHRARKSLSFLGPTQRKEKIGLSIYVFTDGVWEQGPGEVCGVEETIGLAVERLRKSGHLDYRLGIQFIQFGEDPIGSRRLHLLDCHLNEKWGIDM